MLWIRKDIECEQVAVPPADITAALLRLPDRLVLVSSVYVEGRDAKALTEITSLLDQLIRETHERLGTRVDVVFASDFNRRDQLWGGDAMSAQRQGEADPIFEFMSGWSLQSLLPHGTKT